MAAVVEQLPIPGDWIVQGGSAAILGFVALMVFLGWLVPARTYKALERDRDHWRTAALKALGQTDMLLPAAQITTEVTRALAGATGVHQVEQAVARLADGEVAS